MIVDGYEKKKARSDGLLTFSGGWPPRRGSLRRPHLERRVFTGVAQVWHRLLMNALLFRSTATTRRRHGVVSGPTRLRNVPLAGQNGRATVAQRMRPTMSLARWSTVGAHMATWMARRTNPSTLCAKRVSSVFVPGQSKRTMEKRT